MAFAALLGILLIVLLAGVPIAYAIGGLAVIGNQWFGATSFTRLAVRARQRRGDAGIYVHQPVDPGYREHPKDSRRSDHEPQRGRAGGGVPEDAHQGAHSGRIAEIRFAHVRDQQCRPPVQHGEEFLPDWVGIGHVYLHGQRDHGYLADPQHRIVLLRHVPPPSVRTGSV